MTVNFKAGPLLGDRVAEAVLDAVHRDDDDRRAAEAGAEASLLRQCLALFDQALTVAYGDDKYFNILKD